MFSGYWRIFVVLTILEQSSGFTWSEKGIVSAVFATSGHRRYMEDFFIRIENDSGIGIYAIFDGHGGPHSSKFAATFFPEKIGDEIKLFASDPEYSIYEKNSELNFKLMLANLIAEAEDNLKNATTNYDHKSGTTCLLVVAEESKLTVANLGDSRAVMCNFDGAAIILTVDHKPDNPEEKQRIERAGGVIENYGACRVNGLAMSRSLGDYNRKLDKNIIIAEPDISTVYLDEYHPKFMILASDGIWDVISSEEAVDFIKARYLEQEDFGANDLAEHAMHLGSRDNITVIIVVFQNGHYKVVA